MVTALSPESEKAVKKALKQLWGEDWPALHSDKTLRSLALAVQEAERERLWAVLRNVSCSCRDGLHDAGDAECAAVMVERALRGQVSLPVRGKGGKG